MVFRGWIAVLVVTWAGSVAPAGPPVASGSDPFPELEALAPNVDFWTRVFSEWTLGQVVVHDLDHPALVYEIVDLPGPVGGTYTQAQKDWVEALREGWEDYLDHLERKVASGEPLEEIDKLWALHFATVVGSEKLEGAHRRVRTQRGMRERFREGLERSFRLDGPIRAILREHALPEDLAYLPHVESSFEYHARSSAGATGLWQFTRGTGKRYLTIDSTIDERLDPIASTHGAAEYLRDAYERLGSWPLALTSYNHGVQGMLRAKARFGTDFERIFHEYRGRLFGFASRNFYAEFLAARRIASEPELYFPEGFTPEPEIDLDSLVLDSRATPSWLSKRYGVPLDELVILNPAWSSRAVDRGLRLPAGTRVWLPRGTLERAAGGSGSYVVRPGDTLSGIAAAHGISLGRLRELNDLPRGSSLIRAGQELVVGPSAASTYHVVRRGDTLSEIADAYGISLSDLRRHNGLTASDSRIYPGQKLRLMEPGRRHVVRRGDTLLEIAAAHGVRVGDLLAANALDLSSVIHPGQTLHIP